MTHSRPDPDLLLEQVKKEENKSTQGRLKIFLGATAGVGKTFAMLVEAQELRARGIDVVLGYIETHGRKETEALLSDLEQIPLVTTKYKGVELAEFDIDAALKRRPKVLLLDELAHTNVAGSRHAKRWQDVEEILRAGIDVYTAVNIQHLESLNDDIARITGVQVQETIPDSILNRADQVELVDIPAEELIQRLKDGKVYIPEQIEKALQGFFQPGNLIALRELALRRTADQVDAEMQNYRRQHGVSEIWRTKERILVCIAPNRHATRLIRATARMGAGSHAEMIAVSVESDKQKGRFPEEKEELRSALRLAETLGMEVVNLSGDDIVEAIITFATKRNVTLIVVGKPIKPRWQEYFFRSVVDELVRSSGDIDLYVITAPNTGSKQGRIAWRPASAKLSGIAWAIMATAAATGVCLLMDPWFDASNLIMVYLFGVALVATKFGPIESAFASVLSVAVFDFLFVPPYWTFAAHDRQYFVTFGVMLVVALLISSLAQRLKRQAEDSSERERRTYSLYSLSKELSRSSSRKEISEVASKEIREVFACDVAILVYQKQSLSVVNQSKSHFEDDSSERGVALWVYQHNEPAGRGTDTLPGARGIFLPLRGSQGAVGVLAVLQDEGKSFSPPQLQLLETFSNSLGLALERATLVRESQEARIEVATEKMRSSLLGSISHDLRTPLTAIGGAASSLKEGKGDPRELASTIYDESVRLNLQIQNLLDMTRIQSGAISPRLGWESVEELIGVALERTSHLLENHSVEVTVAPNLPLLSVDRELVEKALVNLLENVAKHTPVSSHVSVTAKIHENTILIIVEDTGPGIPAGDENLIFEQFQRRGREKSQGFGLGLAISKAVIELHKGTIWVENRPAGGARFVIKLPLPEMQPEVPSG